MKGSRGDIGWTIFSCIPLERLYLDHYRNFSKFLDIELFWAVVELVYEFATQHTFVSSFAFPTLNISSAISTGDSYLRWIQPSIQTCPFTTRQRWPRELYTLYPKRQFISPATIIVSLVIKHRLLSDILDRNFEKVVCRDGVKGGNVWLHSFL